MPGGRRVMYGEVGTGLVVVVVVVGAAVVIDAVVVVVVVKKGMEERPVNRAGENNEN